MSNHSWTRILCSSRSQVGLKDEQDFKHDLSCSALAVGNYFTGLYVMRSIVVTQHRQIGADEIWANFVEKT